MTPQQRYQLAEAEQAARLTAHRELGVGDLADEIALCRSLIERATNAGHVALASNLLVTLSKLMHSYEQARLRSGEIIDKQAIVQYALGIVEIVHRELLAANHPGWEDVM